MPELPEIETIKLQLNSVLPGKKVQEIKILTDKSFIGNPRAVYGATITQVRRLAKILIIELSNNMALAVHLKMSGQVLYKTENQKLKTKSSNVNLPNKHTRVIIKFRDRSSLFFCDIRMFGWIRVLTTENIEKLKISLGPDPLSQLTEDKFHQILQSSKRPVKLVLMDQEKIAGVGNIYANDALYLAKINPKRRSATVSKKESNLLLKKLQKVLEEGIKWRGASRINFRDIYGQKGEVQEHFHVYDREGERCQNCGGNIEKFKLGGRGTYFCPNCQKT